jgi:hypothetical protein
MFVLGDCETGYVSSFVPCFGSATAGRLIRPDLPFTSGIVLHLCDQLSDSVSGDGFHLYADCFCTRSEQAAELLKKKIILLTRTVNNSRKGLPAQFKRLKMKKVEMQVFYKNGTMISSAWKNKSDILMLST